MTAGADVDARNRQGWAPLHYATAAENQAGLKALISAGADVDVGYYSEDGTPLHMAAANGLADVLEVLIAAGADVSTLDEDHATPLHRAAATGTPEVVALLLDAGAKVWNQVDMSRKSPWHIAEQRGKEDDDFLFSDAYWLLHKASFPP